MQEKLIFAKIPSKYSKYLKTLFKRKPQLSMISQENFLIMVQNYSSCKNLIMQSTNYLQDISWCPQNNNLESSFQKKVLEQIPRATTQFQFNHLYLNFLREWHINKLHNFLTNTKSYVSFNQDFGKSTQPKISVLTLVYYWEWF